MNPASRVRDVVGLMDSRVKWQADPDDVMWLRARHDGEMVYLRINNFPDENMYSLWVGDGEFVELEELAPKWARVGPLEWPATAQRRAKDPMAW